MIYTVTFHRADNYGALLQAYALQEFLLKSNYNTEILNYDNKNVSSAYKLFTKFTLNPLKLCYHCASDIMNLNKKSIRIKKFQEYRDNIKLSEYFKKANEVENKILPNSIFIVGSDQVWNQKWTGGLDDIYTLNFGGNRIKRISYAASCGKTTAIENNKELFFERLNRFDNISVREDGLKDYLKKVINNKVDVVADPTLLLTKKQWERNICKTRIVKEKYIFTYEAGNPNELFYDVINKLSMITGLKIVYFGKNDIKKRYKCKKECYYSTGPEEWLNLLYNAELVVTTSFHGVALSTILNKNVFVVLSTFPDRLLTLLNTVNLENRIIKSIDDVETVFNSNIDWNTVNKKIETERKKSSEWLINAIEECNNE